LLSCFKKWLPKVPILALTGTATSTVENDIIQSLQLSDPLRIRTSSNRPNLSYHIHNKTNPVTDLRPMIGSESTIVYCPTRKDTERIAEILTRLGVKCEAYHAGLAPEVRNEIHLNFINNITTCIVATICFGMGIDKKDIRKVIHYGCPKDIESYCQETGRAGRDGALSQCHVFYAQADFIVNRSFLKDVTEPKMRKHKESMISAIEKYMYTTDCRRQALLDYFGETAPLTDLPCCDNCDHQKDIVTTNWGTPAKIFLELITSIHGSYGYGYGKNKLINVLKGKGPLLPHHPQYGIDHDPVHTIAWWSHGIQHLLNAQLLGEQLMTNGRGSTIYITQQGRKWLSENQSETPTFLIKEIKTLKPPNEMKQNKTPPKEMKGGHGGTRVPPHMVSYQYFNDNHSVQEIAKIRNLTTNTVENHIAKCIESGLPIDRQKIGIDDQTYQHVTDIIKSLNGDCSKLLPIKSICHKNITYFQIKCIIGFQKNGKIGSGNENG
jgi:Werner syndrome ATP-dependent helicase